MSALATDDDVSARLGRNLVDRVPYPLDEQYRLLVQDCVLSVYHELITKNIRIIFCRRHLSPEPFTVRSRRLVVRKEDNNMDIFRRLHLHPGENEWLLATRGLANSEDVSNVVVVGDRAQPYASGTVGFDDIRRPHLQLGAWRENCMQMQIDPEM